MPTRTVDNMEGEKVFKDLDITKDEADRIAKAFENEEFRKLFKEYAEEIADPENRKRYEEELAQLEGERGMDVKFVNPDPGYVIKTSQDGDKKVFINICKNEHIAKPTASKQTDDKGRNGLSWQIPHSFAPPREDIDKAQNKCMVYDVVFSPDTYRMAETNIRFKQLIQDTALDGIEGQFGVKLDKKNLKFPKLKFKGMPRPTVIRTKKPEFDGSNSQPKNRDPDDPFSNIPYPYDGVPSDEKAMKNEEKNRSKVQKDKANNAQTNEKDDGYTKPKYSITHRNEVDFQDFTEGAPRNFRTHPKELVLAIDLPLLTSAKSVDLDIFEKKLVLQSEKPAKYKLDIDLPYAVNEDNGSAKFDKTKRKLIVTLPVIKAANNPAESQVISQENGRENGISKELNTEAKPVVEILPDEDKDTNDAIEADFADHTNTNGSCNGGQNDSAVTDNIEDKSESIIDTHITKSDATPGEVIVNGTEEKEKVYFAEPPFDFQQDEMTVSVVFKVGNVQEESVSKSYPGEPGSTFGLKFVSLGMGRFPIHYSFMMQAPEGRRFKVAASHVDVDETMMVMLLSKDKPSLGLWDKISIGKDESSLLEKYFVTEKALRSELEDLEAAAAMPAPESSPDLLVTDMNENKLAITIKSKKDSSSPEASPPASPPESPPELSPDAQDKSGPKLHSILKQRSRTMSESSDEVFCYSRENSVCHAGSESPISESEEGGDGEPGHRVRKKSVSFSEKVDEQTYKKNQPTTSLRATLKNKRKNQRTAERRHQHKVDRVNKRNRNSDSISEMSSDGEGSSTHDEVSSNHDDTENGDGDIDNKNTSTSTSKNDNVTIIADANGNISTPNDNTKTETTKTPDNVVNQSKNKKNNRRKNRRNKKQAATGDEVATDAHQPPETSSPSSMSEGDGEGKGGDAHECCDNEQVVPKKKLVEIVQGDGHDSDDDGENNSPEDGERTKNETISWEEGKKAAEGDRPCPVSFTNSVMFDLD